MILWLAVALSAFASQTPEERAIDYLRREVQAWRPDNGCFSCHNNGDGARALYRAAASIPELRDTTAWLARPGEWDDNRGDPAVSDKKLARIQFAAALTSAVEAGVLTDRGALIRAADSLVKYQDDDGAWHIDTGTDLGSPVTYGAGLATWMAVRTLKAAANHETALRRAEAWLTAAPMRNVPDAAAVIFATGREEAAHWIAQSQSSDGGWGPYPGSPSEPFDTALAVLALARLPAYKEHAKRGRAHLLSTQLPSGGWPETTRPPGAESYAQHVSTSAWVLLALLETLE